MALNDLVDETDPDYLAARELIERHGVAPGPEGHDTSHLAEAIAARGWAWRLNEGDPTPNDPGHYADARRQDADGTAIRRLARRGETAVVALTLLLADVIRDDERAESA